MRLRTQRYLVEPPTEWRASEVERPERGAHLPEWGRAEDGGLWLRKSINLRLLRGEALGTLLAPAFGVPVATGAADFDERLWYSLRVEGVTWEEEFASQVNADELAKLVAFDLATGNDDRHEGNLMLQMSTGVQGWQVVSIDHEFLGILDGPDAEVTPLVSGLTKVTGLSVRLSRRCAELRDDPRWREHALSLAAEIPGSWREHLSSRLDRLPELCAAWLARVRP